MPKSKEFPRCLDFDSRRFARQRRYLTCDIWVVGEDYLSRVINFGWRAA